MNPALHDCFDRLAQTALALENGWQREAGIHYLEASVAAAEAFPLKSDESEALGVILAAVGRSIPAERAA